LIQKFGTSSCCGVSVSLATQAMTNAFLATSETLAPLY
jgi:hypothetical protein